LAGGSAGLLREGKGSTWEGGMRVPAIAWWPGKVKPGVTGEVACAMDVFRTAVALAGAEPPADRVIDGHDLSGLLRGEGKGRDVFFYYRGSQLYAARKGAFKAHFVTRAGYGKDGPTKHDPPLLFHLGHDPGERHDVATAHPDVLADIAGEAERHKAKLVPGKPQLDAVIPPAKKADGP
jgi:arylsulfatase A